MSRPDKLFDALFPQTAAKFDTRLSARALWVGVEDEADIDRRWQLALCADVLFIRAASYREPFDLFTRPKFWADVYLFSHLRQGSDGMAQKGQRKQDERAVWKGFLDCRLSDEALEALDAWKPKPSEVFAVIDRMMAADYRLTLSYNKRTKLASCTIIDDDPSRKTGGWALSTSDEDGASALKAAVYKHVNVLGEDWSPLLDTTPKSRRG